MMGAAETAPQSQPSHATLGPATPRLAQTSHALSTPKRDDTSYHRKLARVLDAMGALFTLDDILTAIHEGRMQSHVVGNSWAITQIQDFPRARVLNLFAVVGDLPDIPELQRKVLGYADEVNAALVSAHGRRGWFPQAEAYGWKLKTRNWLWQKEL